MTLASGVVLASLSINIKPCHCDIAWIESSGWAKIVACTGI